VSSTAPTTGLDQYRPGKKLCRVALRRAGYPRDGGNGWRLEAVVVIPFRHRNLWPPVGPLAHGPASTRFKHDPARAHFVHTSLVISLRHTRHREFSAVRPNGHTLRGQGSWRNHFLVYGPQPSETSPRRFFPIPTIRAPHYKGGGTAPKTNFLPAALGNRRLAQPKNAINIDWRESQDQTKKRGLPIAAFGPPFLEWAI